MRASPRGLKCCSGYAENAVIGSGHLVRSAFNDGLAPSPLTPRRATRRLSTRPTAACNLSFIVPPQTVGSARGGIRVAAGHGTLIITEKTSQAKDLAAALGDRFGKILPAEGHLLRLAEPDEVNGAWKSWSCVLLKPDGLYPTRAATQGGPADRTATALQ
jgi:hypothetical protein